MRALAAALALATLAAAAPPAAAQPQARYVEGWLKRAQSYHRFAGSDFAERAQQWQGSVVARVPVWRGLSAIVRADTQPQSGEFVFTDSRVWQSVELMGGLSYRALEAGPIEESEGGDVYYRFELGPAAVAGVAVALEDQGDRVRVRSDPLMAFGGAFLRDRRTSAYVYVGGGIHEAVNGRSFALLATLHLPLATERAGLDVDFISGRAQRLVVSLSAQVFRR